MTNARARLRKAREALSLAENSVGLRVRVEVDQHHRAGGGPVLLGPARRSDLIRLLIDTCPPGGWIGLCGVRDIGWEWASREGMELGRVLILNAQVTSEVAQACSLLLDACDVVCLDVPELSRAEQRALSARARAQGRTIVTLRPWPGVSREPSDRDAMRAAV